MNVGELTKRIRSILTEASKLPDVWYHGRISHSTEFDPVHTGKGHDQEGPGFYFTSSLKDARGYAWPGGIVITAKLHMRKLAGRITRREALFLIDNAPDVEFIFDNWDENPVAGKRALLNAIMSDPVPFQTAWYECYRYEPVAFLENMVKLGYDGHLVEKPVSLAEDGQLYHMVVYNKEAIEITDVTELPKPETA